MHLLLTIPVSSSSLLPDPLAKLLTDKENSLLRTPIDYYPESCEIDPYGAVFESEYIVIMPFVLDEILRKAYNTVDVKSFPADVLGNIFLIFLIN